jgi:RNA polymerase sigma factor (sigma-70 family)
LTDKGTHTNTAALTGAAANADGLQQLILACGRNDRAAQRKLYDGYAAFIYGIIRRFTADESVAEDIQSEAFYRIFKRLDQYRFEGAFEGWIRRIAVHAVADYFRKNRPDNMPLSEATEDIAAYHDTNGPAQLAYKELLIIIHGLPPMHRAVFNLFVFEQYAHKEIATLMGITENNSRWHLNDARRRLKEKINATIR